MKKSFSRATAAGLVLADGTAFLAPGAAQAATPIHDLTVDYGVSGMKAAGYAGHAGTVAIRAKNIGSERYYGDFPLVTFRVDVKTASGPQGVDRLIAPGWFNGAYTRDLGFDEKTSTRSFLVTLSNPVEKGQDQLVATLNFGDGLTQEGRVKNYVTATQVGRLSDDTSSGNDQNVDSRQHTRLDTGGSSKSIF